MLKDAITAAILNLREFDIEELIEQMANGYTRREILQWCNEASVNIDTFYRRPFVNYKGKTSDTDEIYTEVVAGWCLENIDKFNAISMIRREASYNMNHDGMNGAENSTRHEEHVAMELFRQSRDIGALEHIGRIIDYQTPLKNKRGDSVGKIDLLAYDGEALRMLELKDEDSEETMLRCVLEGHTYLKTIDQKKLIADFNGKLGSEPKAVKACPLVFEGGYQQRSMDQDMPHLDELIEKMTGGIYYVSKTKPYKIFAG